MGRPAQVSAREKQALSHLQPPPTHGIGGSGVGPLLGVVTSCWLHDLVAPRVHTGVDYVGELTGAWAIWAEGRKARPLRAEVH